MDYLILALATWRIANLLAYEDGPFEAFDRLRHRLGIAYDIESNPYGTNELTKMMLCVWCSSVWIGAVLTIAYLSYSEILWGILPLALSTMTILIDTMINLIDRSSEGFGGES